MAAGSVQIPPNSSGQLVDMVSLSVGGVDVVRQTFALADANHGQTIAEVVGGSASTSAVGVVVRPTTATVALVTGASVGINSIGTVTVTGSIGINSISGLPAIAISGTATVAGVVGLTAGTAVIGDLNAISRTVQVAVGTPFTINNISATTVVSGLLSVTGTVQVAIATPYILQGISTTVQVAIATPYTLQGISTTVTVAGVISLGAGASVGALITGVSNGVAINISTMPAITGSIGINSISAGVSIGINAVSAGVAINTQARAPAVMSASRGPKCVTASTSANVTLIASPGAGANIYIKQLGVHNFSGTFVAMRVGTSASIQTIVVAAQSSGGGAIYNFDPPWMLSASEAALCSVKPNANYGVFNVQFYVI